jgi:hypothetical protein
MAFYEPFNWILKNDKEKILGHGVKNWNSGHKLTEPYFLEYLPLIQGETGVPGLETTFRFEKYIPLDGLTGTLDPAIAKYLHQMVELAQSKDKIAVFSHKSTLGRIIGLRKVFGGSHIFIYKNLWDQWTSYVAQYETGEPHFVNSVSHTILTNQHTPLFRELAYLYGANEENIGFGHFKDRNKACCAFLAFHLFMYMNAMRSADITINVNRLTSDHKYRQDIVSEIEFLSNLNINLDDAIRKVSWYCQLIPSEEIAKVKDLVLYHAKDWAGTDVMDFAISLLDQFCSDSKDAAVFSESIFRRCQKLEGENLKLRQRAVALKKRVVALKKSKFRKIPGPKESLRNAIKSLVTSGRSCRRKLVQFRM